MAIFMLSFVFYFAAQSVTADNICKTRKAIVQDFDVNQIALKSRKWVYINNEQLLAHYACHPDDIGDSVHGDSYVLSSYFRNGDERYASFSGKLIKYGGHFVNFTFPEYASKKPRTLAQTKNRAIVSDKDSRGSHDSGCEASRGLFQRMHPFAFIAQSMEEKEKKREHLVQRAGIHLHKRYLQRDASKNSKLLEVIANTEEFCRICLDSDSHECLISPCRSKGTLAEIHLSCLERWLEESNSSMCELCRHQYTTVRTSRYGIIRSLGLWLASGTSPHLLQDIASLCILTPLAVIGTDFVVTVFAQRTFEEVPEWIVYHADVQQSESILSRICTHLTTLGAISFMAIIYFVHLTWICTQVQYHAVNWYEWYRRHSNVRVVLPPEVPDKDDSSAGGQDKIN